MTRRRGTMAAAVLLCASFLALHFIRLVEPLGVDQGLFACFARWVPRGWLPYRDLFDSKPPLYLYWWSLARIVPGELPRSIWWLEGIWLFATLLVAYAFVRRLWGRVAGLATAALLVVGLWSPTFGGYWSRAQAEEILVLPTLLSAWAFVRAREGLRFAFVAGLFAGVCGVMKIPSMAIAGAWSISWMMERPRALSAKRVGLAFLGVLVPWAFAFAWFAAHYATADFVEAVFVYQRHIAAFMAPPFGHELAQFGRTLVAGMLPLMVSAALGLFLLARRRARETWWLGAWIVLTMAAILSQRQLAGYHFLLAVPALAVTGGYGIAVAVRALRSRARVASLVALVLLLAAVARDVSHWTSAYGPDLTFAMGRMSRWQYLREIQAGTYSSVMEENAASYLRAHVPADRGVLVWGLSPGIYALADRHPTTRFPFHKILYTEAPLSRMVPGLDERRAQLLDRMRKDPPAYVLVARNDTSSFEPLDSMASLRAFPELNAMIERDFMLEKRIGHFDVLRRR